MSVLKPRNRLVNFRLTEEEYAALYLASGKSGARSLSDFARSAVLRAMESVEGSNGHDCNGSLITRVNALVELLEAGAAKPVHAPVEPSHN